MNSTSSNLESEFENAVNAVRNVFNNKVIDYGIYIHIYIYSYIHIIFIHFYFLFFFSYINCY